MKLNITFVRDANGKDTPVITDDRGHRMPRVRGVTVRSEHDAATEVVITLVVDRVNVTLGDKSP